ncbi:MAG: hypothetical protein V1820_03385, partial [archaeon]
SKMAGKNNIRKSDKYKEIEAYVSEKERGSFASTTPTLVGLSDNGLSEIALGWLYREMELERNAPSGETGKKAGFLFAPAGSESGLGAKFSYAFPVEGNPEALERARKLGNVAKKYAQRNEGKTGTASHYIIPLEGLPEAVAGQLEHAEITLGGDCEENPASMTISLRADARKLGGRRKLFSEIAKAANILTAYVETGELPQSFGEKLEGLFKPGRGRDRTPLPGRYGPEGEGRPRC